MYDNETASGIFYVTFNDLLNDGRSLKNVIVFIDEIDVFLKLPARITATNISSPFDILTNSCKVVGVSATFGGE